MGFSISQLFLLFFFFFFQAIGLGHDIRNERQRIEGEFGRRVLLGFKETPKGSNVTFACSPSGPCVPCLYSEKGEEKYRCSETGYRIPLKCVETKNGLKHANEKKPQNSRSTMESSQNNAKSDVVLPDSGELTTSIKHRNLLDNASQAYITFRSCIPAVNEEKLSVLGFEGIVLCLLIISGSVVFFRRKRTVVMAGAGAGRIQTNSRF